MALSKVELKSLRHKSEASRFYLTLFVLIPVALLLISLVVLSFGLILLYLPFLLFFLWVALKLFIAHHMNNSVLVTETSFPEIWDAINEAKEHFGYNKTVDAYVFEAGTYNIGLLPLLGRKALMFNSELMADDSDVNEKRFLVGRFVGGLASKHYRFGWLEFLINSVEKIVIFNIVLYPYERSVIYTGDQLGLHFIHGDTTSAVSVLTKLMVGKDIASKVNTESIIKQGYISRGSFFSWLARMLSPFPHTISRVRNILEFAHRLYDQNPGDTVKHLDSNE
ncbi:MAG: hypothetical protein ABJ275_02685 [Maricaulaceae bacterium]